MEYYNIDIDYTPSITGKRDGDVAVAKKKESFSSKEQEKEFNDFFINNYKNKSRVMITDFQLFNTKNRFMITYFPRTKSIKQLDFMAFGPYEHGVQFLISHRVYEIIAKYRLPIHNKITAKVDTFSQNYYLVGFPMLPVSVYDFNKSTFSTARMDFKSNLKTPRITKQPIMTGLPRSPKGYSLKTNSNMISLKPQKAYSFCLK